MFDFGSGEPFGLPKGTVRGIIALAFSVVTLQQFVALGHAPDPALLGITTLIIGNYFGSRNQEAPVAKVAKEEPLPAPAIAGDAA